MIMALGQNHRVLWIHENDAIKEGEPYKSDELVLVVDKEISIPEVPYDEYMYIHIWNPDTKEIYLERGTKKEVSHEEVTKQTHIGVAEVSGDNLTNMDLLMMILDNQQKIMTHLGIK